MGIFGAVGEFFGGGAAKAVTGTVEGIANVFDKFIETEDEKTAAKLLLAKMAQRPAELQVEINKLEAVHRSTFVSGWRPFIGWILGTSLAFYYIPQFAMASILWVRLCWNAQTLIAYPITEIHGLTELVFAMLGMAGLRTVEKFGGVSK